MRPTQEFEKRILILFSLFEQNSSASKRKTLDYLEENNLVILDDYAKKIMGTRNEEKWRNSFAFIRKHLVINSYISDEIRDNWQLTENGLNYFYKLLKELKEFKYDDFKYISEICLLLLYEIKLPGLLINHNHELETNIKHDLLTFKLEEGYEGSSKKRYSNYYERKQRIRKNAIQLHGLDCMACGFNFEKFYGGRGKNYIEAHHIIPISQLNDSIEINAERDIIVLCSNCHRMVHRKLNNILTLDELKRLIKDAIK